MPVMKNTVSTSGAMRWFMWAICSSDSKSLMARRPRTMWRAPTARASSTVSPSKRPRPCTRSCSSRPLRDRLADARRTRSSPVAVGALRGVDEDRDDDAVEDRRGAPDDVEVPEGDGVERAGVDGDPHAGVGSCCIGLTGTILAQRGLAEAPIPHGPQPAGPRRRRVLPEVLGDDDRIVAQPAQGRIAEQGQRVRQQRRVRVGRVDDDHPERSAVLPGRRCARPPASGPHPGARRCRPRTRRGAGSPR